METIDKATLKMSKPKVDIKRQCGDCACFDKKGWCQLHRHTAASINYACKHWLTQEELEARLKEKEAYLESEKGVRVNYMLTLMFAFVSAAYQIMTRSESILG